MTPRNRASDRHCGGWGVVLTLIAVAYIVLLWMLPAHGAAIVPVAKISIPQQSYLYRFKLEREVSSRFGTTDPVARVAGQVHDESLWKPNAKSAYAEGMAQFTPDTAKWLESVCPEIGPPDTWDPNWSVRAVVCYDHYLFTHVDGATACDAWAFTLSAYNGGLGWVSRDKRRASATGADPARWFASVEKFSARADWARAENRSYVSRILLVLEPLYVTAGWPGQAVCP